MDYETVIGLETHVQLKTDTKLFCGCPTRFGADPNAQVCPVCLGMPGVLPVLNHHAFELALQAGLALNGEIAAFTKFDRKNYFYPDLPKGYQISQYDLPFCRNGFLEIETAAGPKRVRIHRIHVEEDAGKLIHPDLAGASDDVGSGTAGTGRASYSLVDLNRCGMPLVEIVTEADLRSPAEAHAYLDALKAVLQYVGVSDCDMEKGSLRCDANISIRPRGTEPFGVKVEVKNVNSFRFVEQALQYEAERQVAAVEAGERIVQETRTYDAANGVTRTMRSKEEANDYRYFPEPDLCPVTIDEAWIARLRKSLPELPQARRERFVREYALSPYDAGVMTASRALADYFETACKAYPKPKSVANWVMGEVLREMNDRRLAIEKFPIDASRLAALAKLFDDKALTNTAAKEVFAAMMTDGRPPDAIVAERGLAVVSDIGAIEAVVDRILAADPKPVQDYRAGKKSALGAIVGMVMKETKGKASPSVVQEILKKRLD